VQWEGDATGDTLIAEVEMNAPRAVRAVFAEGDDPASRPIPGGIGCGAVGALQLVALALGLRILGPFRSGST
jgi:hypothetical protein